MMEVNLRIADPEDRRPYLLRFCTSGIFEDKINTFVLKQKLIRKSIKGIFCKSKVKFGAIEKLRIQLENDWSFFQTLFSGIFLENKLETPIGCLILLWKCFQRRAALPALGMEEIPKQLAIQLPADTFFVQYKSRRHSWEQHFNQHGCWNKIGHYSCYWGKRIVLN
jgi:hypothetical protein